MSTMEDTEIGNREQVEKAMAKASRWSLYKMLAGLVCNLACLSLYVGCIESGACLYGERV